MIKLTEEILRMSDKELQKTLSDNPYKSKYYVFDNELFERTTKVVKNNFLVKGLNTSLSTNRVEPFSYKLYLEHKKELQNNLVRNISQDLFESYLMKVASDVYGNENVDIVRNENHTILVVYFKEIKITNSSEQEHIIKDLYVKIPFVFKQDRLSKLGYISVNRATYTEKELLADYVFSHNQGVPKDNTFNSSMCFGYTELAEVVERSKGGRFTSLQQLFIQLNEYFRWESLEGTPYRRIDSVINLRQNGNGYVRMPSVNHDLINKCIVDIEDIGYIYRGNGMGAGYVVTNGYIKLTHDSIHAIEQKLTETFPAFCYPRNGMTSCVSANAINSSWYREGEFVINFKGVDIKRSIIRNLDTFSEVKLIHHDILNRTVMMIEELIYFKILSNKLEENYGE